MLLRDHPLMMYNGIRSWPPVWVWSGGNNTTNPKGEVGILHDAILSNVPPNSTCFLIMEHLGAEYIGALLLSDRNFCRVVHDVLNASVGGGKEKGIFGVIEVGTEAGAPR